MNMVMELEERLRTFETSCAAMFAQDDVFTRQMNQSFNLGFELALLGMRLAVLEMTIQGVLPDGRAGRIMAAIADRMNASKERALGIEQQPPPPPLPGAQLPEKGR